MNTIQTLVVYMWLVPVLGFIVFPLFWSAFGLLYRFLDRSRLSDIRGFVALNDRDRAKTGKVENRSRPRIRLDDGTACIDEKNRCYRASVLNISKQGVCLHDVPQKLYRGSNPLKVLFRTRQKDYTVTVRPIWKKKTGRGYDVGARIDKIPTGWKDLVTGLNHSLTFKTV